MRRARRGGPWASVARPAAVVSLLVVIALPVRLATAADAGGGPAAGPSGDASAVAYRLSFPNAVHHEARVRARFTGVTADTLEVRMSRSSPGRYAAAEFVRNVYDFRAADGSGRQLPLTKPDPSQWNVPVRDGTVEVSYTLFGDRANGTYNGIDPTHAHLNMPATLVWARGAEEWPVTVEFDVPDGSGWKAATQLFPTGDPMTFTAPGLQYLMDSPTELSAFTLRTWTEGEGDSALTFRIALHHDGTDAEADAYAAMARRVVREAREVFGEFPRYDTRGYTFIVDYLPWVSGDGMEHRNSTIICGTRPLRESGASSVGTIAHEFFHCWNVERMRPRSLEPFDFGKANMSSELWFAEGVTDYYDRLVRMRAGIFGLDEFTSSLGSTLGDFLESPARSRFSAAEMSAKAPLFDGALVPDRTNGVNTWYSYYPFGDMIGLALDLSLRAKEPGLTLDGFLRTVWARHGRTELPYANDDLERELGKYAADTGFAAGFFASLVNGRGTADYAGLLLRAGLVLRRKDSAKATLGRASLDFRGGGAVLVETPPETSPLYAAGLDRGDTLRSIDGEAVDSREELDALLGRHRPGDAVEVEFSGRGRSATASLTLGASDRWEVVPAELTGTALSGDQRRFREEWLGAKDPSPAPALAKYCPECSREYLFQHRFCPSDGKELKITRD